MKAREIMEELFSWAENADFDRTCDTCKAGDPEQEVTKVAVSMFATPDIVRKAAASGAQLLIVHEPTYYNHWDDHSDDPQEQEKRRLIQASGLTVYRYHDHAHAAVPDLIGAGEFEAIGLPGTAWCVDSKDHVRYTLEQPITPRELARRMEQRMGLHHVRIAGAADEPCTVLSGMFGTPAGVLEEIQSESSEIVLTGEICEWALGEYVRDAAQLGKRKALLVMSHIGSERDGMRYVAKQISRRFPALTTEYLECGEVYTYTDCD